MAAKPSIPKGTRDFGPVEMSRRNYIFGKIKDAFRLFGYRQIETPSLENLSTLLGKYGEEGDRLLFKVLNSGDFLKGITEDDLAQGATGRLAAKLCDKGLRYDLTVPFARYVVQHRNELQMPFKRWQMQPVWRADRPQKGRYREFYQCDADVVGTDSLLCEAELLKLIDTVFDSLGISVTIKINNRKVLAGIAEAIGEPEKIVDITVAIDKIDKIGLDNVKAELSERGLSAEAVEKLCPVLELNGTTEEKLAALEKILAGSETGLKGVEELREVFALTGAAGHKAEMELDASLARGLNYYTGTIIEVKANDVEIGSITGGGRYDNLTGVFGMPGLSGVGISFGADRIYDVMTTLDLFPKDEADKVSVMFANLGQKESLAALKAMALLREQGIACEIYPDKAKLGKQMTYANNSGIGHVAIIGESEMANGTVTLKNMVSGDQTELPVSALADELRR